MKILVLGGDGFIGWPVSLHLSAKGHDVTIIDNLSRRNIDNELEVGSLTPIRPMGERLDAWRALSGQEIAFIKTDIAGAIDPLYRWYVQSSDVVVHLAEQRAAPYSMKSPWHKRYTVENNVRTTHNLLGMCADLPHPPHIVHIGTMGVYGYGTAPGKIPEGYLNVQVLEHDGKPYATEILHPTNPGSVYHMTKVMDQTMFAYYAKNDHLCITDLHQGIVWGTQTTETSIDEALINRFDYDGDYGTVLNRFLMQAAIGYPLTVHGTGGQTRAFIHIQNTVECVSLAIDNPPAKGERVKILNQMSECHRVIDLAELVAELFDADIELVDNPRNEDAENDLSVTNDSLLELGLVPKLLSTDLMDEVVDVVDRYGHHANRSKIPCVSRWT